MTALAAGEINLHGGPCNLAVAVSGQRGAMALLYRGSARVLRGEAEEISLPAEASCFAFGPLDDDYSIDIAVAAGADLVIVHGKEPGLSAGPGAQAAASRARVEKESFGFIIRSIVAGRFGGPRDIELALLGDDNTVHVRSSQPAQVDGRKAGKRVERARTKVLARGDWSAGSKLVPARLGGNGDDLLVIDPAGKRLHVLARGRADRAVSKADVTADWQSSVSLEAETEMVAVLPMRLNADGLTDLVVLGAGTSAPSAVFTASVQSITVTNNGDSGSGSLRQAIIDANSSGVATTITFAIPGNGVPSINLLSSLPGIGSSITVDATTQPGGRVELNGASAGSSSSGLLLGGQNSVARGFVINRFFRGILLAGEGSISNYVEGNYIGTDTTGTINLGNALGVQVGMGQESTVKSNVIGGTVSQARNIISGNTAVGVRVSSAGFNVVQGNYIGTDVTGKHALGNGSGGIGASGAGVTIFNGFSTLVTGNVISGNKGNGVFFEETGTNTVDGNLIGTNATGTADLGNTRNGVIIGFEGSANTVRNNLISGNDGDGVAMLSIVSTTPFIEDNRIGTDITGTLPVGNSGNGITLKDTPKGRVLRNIIAFNGKSGIAILETADGNTLSSNGIFSNGIIGIDLGGDNVTQNDLGDGDFGPNSLQNYPVLTSATFTSGAASAASADQFVQAAVAGQLVLSVTFNSERNKTYILEFYFGGCSPGGSQTIGSIPLYLGQRTISTDGNGNASQTFTFDFTPPQQEGYVNCTATNPSGSTSEFSQCLPVGGIPPPQCSLDCSNSSARPQPQ